MKIVVFGAGQMSQAIVFDLVHHVPEAEIVVADISESTARSLAAPHGARVRAVAADATRPDVVRSLVTGARCVIGATTYKHNLVLTELSIAAGAHFCDLGGNNDVVNAQRALTDAAVRAGVTIVPDCGLAPGMVNVLAYYWAHRFDVVDELRIRVGGLPARPENSLGYALVFSVEGLINEYVEDAVVLRRGKIIRVPSLTEIESLSFGKRYPALEAFHTSGGSSTLPETLRAKVKTLEYKTIRYPGHGHAMRVIADLGLMSSDDVDLNGTHLPPRRLLANALRTHLPSGVPDIALIRLELKGRRGKKQMREVHDCIDCYNTKQGLSAMQRTTGFSIAIIAAMLARGQVTEKGTVPQELAIDGAAFLKALAKRGIKFS